MWSIDIEDIRMPFGEIARRAALPVVSVAAIVSLVLFWGSLPSRTRAGLLGLSVAFCFIAFWWLQARVRLARRARRLGPQVAIAGGVIGALHQRHGLGDERCAFDGSQPGYLLLEQAGKKLWMLPDDRAEPVALAIEFPGRCKVKRWAGRVWFLHIETGSEVTVLRAFGRWR